MRQALTSLLVAGLAVAGVQIAHPQGPPPATRNAQPAVISMPGPQVLLMLVRSTLTALNQANFTGDYSVLHALGTPRLQASVSPVELGIAFTELRAQNLDLSPVLLLAPALSEPATLTPDGALRVAGDFGTSSATIAFVTVFRPVEGIWRLDALSVQALPVAALAQSAAMPKPIRKH
jgi:hypothetical protein